MVRDSALVPQNLLKCWRSAFYIKSGSQSVVSQTRFQNCSFVCLSNSGCRVFELHLANGGVFYFCVYDVPCILRWCSGLISRARSPAVVYSTVSKGGRDIPLHAVQLCSNTILSTKFLSLLHIWRGVLTYAPRRISGRYQCQCLCLK